MKIAIISASIFIIIFTTFQYYTNMSTKKSETQPYKVIRKDKEFEIRYYPTTLMATISSTTKSYDNLGYSGFSKLAKFIFGGNSEKKQIAMTSPVHMDIGDSIAKMSFVMPSTFKQEDLPKPDNSEIKIQVTAPEFVAALQFDGFATTSRINKYKAQLKKSLQEKGISYTGNFRYLGYNPPYQLFGRRNEVIITVHADDVMSK